MYSAGRSFWFVFRLLCIVCCVIAATSYKIDYDSSIDDRYGRGVTEWRFRRNYPFDFPEFLRNHIRSNHNEGNDNQLSDEIEFKKKFIIPELIYHQSQLIKK